MAGRKRKRTQRVDWAALHARLERARNALARGTQKDGEHATGVLAARARALAVRPPPAAPRETLDVVEFSIAGERYAIESAHVREVQQLRELTPLPGAARHVRGLVNLRGQMLAVVDLARLFELPERGLGDLNRTVVLSSQAMEFALLADRIAGVGKVALAAMRPSLPTLTGIRERYLRGVTAEGLVVLDGAKLLADGAATHD